jgi:GNAT superfamily N-acetyltransferase
MRIATIDDAGMITSMTIKFLSSVPYGKYSTEDAAREVVEGLLASNRKDAIIIAIEDKGFIAGIAKKFPYGDVRIATEIGWWVEPEHRKSKIGGQLIDAFEYWASQVNCEIVTMMCLTEELRGYYEKRGYVLSELAFMKEI